MADAMHDRPYGDGGFESPMKRGWVATGASIIVRAVIAVAAGAGGRVWPRQLPLDPPAEREQYRP